MKAVIMFLTVVLAQSAFGAVTLRGMEPSNKACGIYLEDEASATADGEKAHLINIRFSGMHYSGILAKQTSPGVFEFDNLMMDNGNGYSRVIGAPITFAGIGILQLKGVLNLKEQTVKTNARGLSVFSWWKRADVCSALQVMEQ